MSVIIWDIEIYPIFLFMNLIRKFCTWEGILDPSQIKGDMPSNKEIYKRTFSIAWPSALESVLIALIGAVDMIMVGFLGKEAISAVGICNQPKFIVLAPILALNTATIVLVARRKGENRKKDANDYTKIAILFSCILCVVFCLTAFVYAKELLEFAGAQADYIDLSVSYFQIVLLSLIPYSIGLTITSAQRGAGYTKISLVTNLTANIINIIFNALLIHGYCGFPALGVVGAAIATAIGNCVSFFIALIPLFSKNRYIHFTLEKVDNFVSKSKKLFDVAFNAFIEQIFIRVGFFFYAKVVADLGTAEFAAHQVCMNIMSISFSFGDGLQVANTSLVGQSLGERRSDLAIVYTRIAQFIGIVIAALLCLAVSIFSEQIVHIFAQEEEVIALASLPMKVLGFTILFQIPQVIIVGALRGAGDVRFVAWMMFLCVGIIRPILSYIFAYPLGFGLIGAWIGLFLDQFMRFTLSIVRFHKGKWLDIRI